jgi:maltose alpha-D-glucosyltransferase/alpha-amylase
VNVLPQIEVGAKLDDELWFKDAIIYQLHVKTFSDSNGDGIGDFNGLTERLDYLHELGVTAVWLLPFYPSPGRDDGYDIADYRRINPDFGTMKDFRRFMTEAKRRGLRVITELVINHTSDQHPWFKRARRSASHTDARNWYVWSDTDQKYAGTRVIFTDTEKSNWTWDSEAQAFYWHRFFSHQPDLNFDNPRVLWAIVQVMRRWLDMGVDGFRLDAIPYLCEREGTNNENLPETHAVIRRIREELDAYAPGRVLLAEANQWPEDVSAYFGAGDECHMAYHFPLMPRIYMAIAQADRFPITDILRQTPDIPENCQWALFLRNHDELTLEMVTDSERDYLWSTYAAETRARINLGIRRRLAPLMDNDRRKIELMNSLLLSFPGAPIIYYGDEIGMGDNIYLGDRNGVRTPMQWTSDRNGGFSRCDPARLNLPIIMDPVYGYQSVNVEAQSRNLSSLLSWMKRLISVRKSSRVFGRGSLSFVRPANRSVLVYVRQYEDETILCVANLSRSAQAAEIDLSPWRGRVPLEMIARTRFPRIGETPYVITLAPYGFFWFLLCDEGENPEDKSVRPAEFVTLVMREGWDALLAGRNRYALEQEALPLFLSGRRWFAEKAHGVPTCTIEFAIPIEHAGTPALLMFINVGQSRYVLPLCVTWQRFDQIGPAAINAIAAARRGPREGTLLEAAVELDFVSAMLAKMHEGATLGSDGHTIEMQPTEAFRGGALHSIDKVQAVTVEQSNTTIIIDESYVLKIFRRLSEGIHPEIEIGRFLTDIVRFPNAPPLLGSAELVEGERRGALATLHSFVGNQGDAWTVTAGYLDRFVDEQRVLTPDSVEESAEQSAYLLRIAQIGRRSAELHQAFASRDDLPAFAPEPVSTADIEGWTSDLVQSVERTFDLLQTKLNDLAEEQRTIAAALLNQRAEVVEHVASLLPRSIEAFKIRQHGDFHLGQVLMVKDDAYILDFEGEPLRSAQERRAKWPAARDVAGLVRSIDYSVVAALDRALQTNPDDRLGLAPKLEVWRERAEEAYWSAYHTALNDRRLWPEHNAEGVLEFFLLEKAFYEIDYELANRPAWVRVPLAGVWRILVNKNIVSA